MIESVYRPKRKKEGKTVTARLYRGRYRLDDDFQIRDVPLDTPDRQVARKRLRDIIIEAQKEGDGLVIPRMHRNALLKPLADHLKDYLADLTSKGRVKKYVRLMEARNERLICDCPWRVVPEVTADRFINWRSRHGELSPKTLNEYLNSATGFLNWMVKQGRTGANPLRLIDSVETRGKQQKRRAFDDAELGALLGVAGSRRLLYLTAAYTGLRLGEIRQLVWGDLKLDCARPYIHARDSTTKNKKEAIVPLHSELIREFCYARPELVEDADSVFNIPAHPEYDFRRDLEEAGIRRFDSMGRKVDFHALRYTFATMLAKHGVPQRLAQHLMRHSDPRLTSMVYTDASQLPTFDVVENLPWAGNPSISDGLLNAQIDSQTRDFPGHAVAQGDNDIGGVDQSQRVEYEGARHFETRSDPNWGMVPEAGFEPATKGL